MFLKSIVPALQGIQDSLRAAIGLVVVELGASRSHEFTGVNEIEMYQMCLSQTVKPLPL